jgi:catechol 2,3-dioxygenase-like lactoylglutathione lyase family enzyme/ketosteroid isomerase-like protein
VIRDARELVRRTWDAFDAGDEERFLACFAPGWVEHYGELTATVDDALGALRRYADELTGRETVIEQLLDGGDLVAVRTTRLGTHRASGRAVRVHEISIHRIENGRLAETWTESASPGVVAQIAPAVRIDHVKLPVSDVAASRAFYSAALAPLGYTLVYDRNDELGFGAGDREPFGLLREQAPNVRSHVAFTATSTAEVDTFHAAALAAGGRDNGAPGERTYGGYYYAAFVLDPDGHNVEAVFHG